MLDMMRMLTLLNSGTEEEEEARTASSKDLEDNDVVVVEERMDVLIIGILMVACLGLILIVVAVYFFRKMVAIENSKFSSNSQISLLPPGDLLPAEGKGGNGCWKNVQRKNQPGCRRGEGVMLLWFRFVDEDGDDFFYWSP